MVACQLVIKQILDVLDVIAPVEVRENRNWFLMWLLASWLSNKFWMFSM
ncbi:DUF2766 family protein [Escherichia coli]